MKAAHSTTRRPRPHRSLAVPAAVTVALAGAAVPAAAATTPPVFSPATYGALPSDGRDDTAAFAGALRAAADAGNGVVRVAAGTYEVLPDRLTVGAGTTLTGSGAVLAAADHGFNLLSVARGATVSSLTVDGRDRVVRGITVAAGATDVKLTSVTVKAVATPRDPAANGFAANARQTVAGIHVAGNTSNVLLDRVVVDGVRAVGSSSPNVTTTAAFDTDSIPVATNGWWRHNAYDAPAGYQPPVDAGQVDPVHQRSRSLVTSPVRAGSHAWRSELHATDPAIYGGSRSELTRRADSSFVERWYGVSVLLPAGGPEDYAVDRSAEAVVQWHNSPDACEATATISPPLALLTKNGQWQLHRWWDADPCTDNSKMYHAKPRQQEEKILGDYAADKGKWTDWAFHIRWGWSTAQKPLLEVYKNRQLVYRTVGPNTVNDAVPPYLKFGIYKWDWSQRNPSDTTTRVIYHDEVRIDDASGSLDTVSPPVPPGPPGAWDYPVARGVLISSGPGQTIPRNVTVRGSTIRNVGPKDDGDCLVVQGNGATVEPDAHTLITGNTFTGCAKRAVKVQVPGVQVVSNKITNGFLGNNPYVVRPRSIDTADMFAGISVYASRVTVSGNSITGTGSAYAGIDVDNGPLSDLTVTGNVVVNGRTARLAPASLIRLHTAVDRLTLTGNSGSFGAWGVRCDVAPTATRYALNRVTATSPGFGCVPPPTVASAAELRARGGDPLTLTGTGFGADLAAFRAAGITVSVNGRSTGVTWLDASTLRVLAPAGAPGTRPVVVLSRGGVAAAPVEAPGRYAAGVTSLRPSTVALTGGLVTVTGIGLRDTTGWQLTGPATVPLPRVADRTALNAAPSGVVVVSDTSVVVKLPAAADVTGDGRADPGTYTLGFTPAAGTPYLAVGPTAILRR
ncbi:heparin lyase I family protein [Couchioplanes azureus]|uniref:heparin lyase I family protein n=1 Tax=Couchioplanes caeruleus TaxID=56438 RepID=UPI00166F9FD6|nr:heparin lyase I family protein [Couchioplanes caeruleus]GGQ47938.1 hypothetical protein GCM10010166_15050 [Couchioplanes caeruleus subsp. azureus]